MKLTQAVERVVPYRVIRACRILLGETVDLAADRRSRWFAHQLAGFDPSENFQFKVDVPGEDQAQIIQRLVDYYHRQTSEYAAMHLTGNDDMWSEITDQKREFQVALEQRDTAKISDYLLHVWEGTLATGFKNSRHYADLVANERARTYEAQLFADKLLSLSDALGCTPVQCPEQGQWGYEHIDFAELLHSVQERLPMAVDPPAAGGGAFGLNTKYGVLCLKDLSAMYMAYRIHDILERDDGKIVAEIGGGSGTLAYYLAKAGMNEVWVYDLPLVSLVQGYYAMKGLGPDAVRLHGEPERPAEIHLMPYWQAELVPDKDFSLFINQDSLPEIEISAASRYIDLIKTKCKGYFLSVNQEGQAPNSGDASQSIVHELVRRSDGYRRIYRFPDWMRVGYVEELYKVL